MSKIIVLLLLFVYSPLLSQTITPVPPKNGQPGYLEYLPPSYNSTTEKYPCIIFLHGSGEIGNGLEPDIWKVAYNGPFKEIKVNKHTMCFTVNGKQECFIVIGPQSAYGAGWYPPQILSIYNYLIKTYRIDTDRVYLTGLSMGGEDSYGFAGDTLNSNNIIAALGIMSASTTCTTARQIGNRNIPVWHHHGDKDNTVHNYANAVNTIDCINSRNPNPAPIFTVYPNTYHSAWNQGYATDHTYNNPNTYEWFLGYRLNKNVKVDLGIDRLVTLPANSITLNSTITSTNPVQTYAWTKQAGPAATLNNANTQTLTASNLVQGTYIFRLTVTDSKGNSAFDDITVIVQPAVVNQPPVANAGADKLIALPTNTAVFNGTGSDVDGTVASYAWVKVSGPAVTLTNQNAASLTASNLVAGAYVFGLTVTDDDGATGYDEVRLTVEAANLPPTVNAGIDRTIQLPTNTITLNGTASDPDGTVASYLWTKQSGPTATLQNVGTANLTASNLLQGTYIFRLTATDNDGATAYDEVRVIVQAINQSPIANAGVNQTLKLPLNSTNLAGTGSDNDGSIASYNWVKVSGPAATLTNTSSTTLSISALVQGTYVFGLTVTDDKGATGYDEVTVTVNAANVAPVANAGADRTVNLPTNSITISGIGSDADGSIVGYLWTKKSGPTAVLTNSTNATISISSLVEGTYTFTLQVTDNDGAKHSDDVIVTVLAANIPPSANAGADVNITLPTNQLNLTGTGTDTDGSISTYNWVKVSGPTVTISGQNSTTLQLTNLIQGTYVFGLTVTDDDGATGYDEVRIIVAPEPVNLLPTVNAGTDLSITLPQNSVNLSATSNDPDGSIVTILWQKISGPAATINPVNNGNTTISGLVAGTYRFRITVTDDKGATAFDEVNINVFAAIVNQPPVVNIGSDVSVRLPLNTATFNPTVTDSDGTIASYAWTQISGPNTATITNGNTKNAQAGNLVSGTYTFRLTVTDDDGAIDFDDVNVIVDLANQKPTVNAGNDRIIQLPVNSISITATATDLDGSIASYLWTRVSGPNGESITNAANAIVTINNLSEGVYVFQVQVTDNEGATATDQVKVTVQAANKIPVANAGPDIQIQLPISTANLPGSGSDADGTIAAYEWSKISGPMAVMVNQNTSTLTLNNLVEGVYVFRLTVTDDQGASNFDEVTVTVLPAVVNNPPTANAGTDKSITLPTNSVTLTGSGTDSDGSIVSYSWVKITGPTAQLTNANNPTLSVTNLIEGVYTFRLTVQDNGGLTATDDVRVLVNPQIINQNPVANAGTDKILTLPTNSINLIGQGSDADGSIASYLWEKVTGPTVTITGANNSTVQLTNLVEGSYVFKFTVIDDDGASAFDQVVVTVNSSAVNNAPVANAGPNRTITLPTNTIILNGSGSDTDGTIVTYLWQKISGSTTTLTNTNSAILTASGLSAGSYVFRLTVTDDDGAVGTDDVSVTVNNLAVNISPVVNAGSDLIIKLPTNTAVIKATASDADGTVVSYSWVKISGPAATLSNTSTATLTINNLVAGNYTFRITVTDDKGSTDNDDVNVQVIIETTNQVPVADAGADIQINLPTNAVSITGKGTDVDGSIVAYQWTKISGPAVTVQNISTSTILLTNLEEGDYTFRLTVTDNSGDSGSDDVVINVGSQTVNKAPTANAGMDRTVYLPDNSVEISGSGSDLDGIVTSYLWEKTSGGFVTMAGSATSTLNVSGMLEGNYEFSLTVTDDDGATGTDYVRVTVYALAANKPPTVDLGNNLIKYMPLDSIYIVAKATDPDGQIVQYTWRKLSGGTLLIQPTDSLLVLKDFAPGSYTIRLTVTDNNGETASDDISITIISASTNRNPVGDAGIDLYVNLPQDTISVFGSASDPDNDILTLVWTKLTGPVVTMTGINSPTLSLSDLKVGTYKFEITVTDSKDASASDQMYLQVFEAPAENLVPIADAGDDVILNIPFTDYQHIGSGIDQDGLIISYEWRMIDGPVIDNTVVYSDTLTLTGLAAGEYTYEFIVTDDESAVAIDELTVKVFSEELSDIGAHKVFSPDGNGIDDLWIIDNLDKVTGCPVTIFNRFGLKVFESNNYQNDWDGFYNGNPLPEADYYFIVSCENSKNTTSGGIRIIRDY